MILYGRNPVKEALRGRRAHAVSEVWATANAAKEPWLEGVKVRVCGAEDIERRCGSPVHQGVCAEAGGYPYVAADELLGAPIRGSWRSTRCRTLRTSARSAAPQSVWAPPAWSSPSVARQRSRPPCARRRPAPSSTSVWRGCATSPTSSSRRVRRGVGPMEPVRRWSRPQNKGPENVMYTAPDYSGGSCSCLGARGPGCVHVWRRMRPVRGVAATRAYGVARGGGRRVGVAVRNLARPRSAP